MVMFITMFGKSVITKLIVIFTVFAILVYCFVAIIKADFLHKVICKDCNVVMVSLDTLSANHLPCYGYDRNTAPNLCSFADKNISFKNVYANSSWTLPSHVSVFTGLYPSNHGVNIYTDRLGTDKILLPELLKTYGYNTMFFIPKNDATLPVNGLYDRIGDGLYDNGVYGWDKSIDMFKQSVRAKKKTFMFLHTYDVHSPYLIGNRPPIYPLPDNSTPFKWEDIFDNYSPGFVNYYVSEVKKGVNYDVFWQIDRKNAEELFAELKNAYPDYPKSVAVLKKIRQSNPNLLFDSIFYYNYSRKFDSLTPAAVETLRSLYDQAINILDTEKIPLLTSLIEDAEFKENTILIIFADHGEEFMEHGHLFHETIYNSTLRVPLVMHIPGMGSRKIANSKQLVDIFPTLIQILGIKTNISFDGTSLFKTVFGMNKSDELIVADGWNLESRSLIYGPWKLFLSKQADNSYIPHELYNLDKDPAEKNNVLFENTNIKDEILKKYGNSAQ